MRGGVPDDGPTVRMFRKTFCNSVCAFFVFQYECGAFLAPNNNVKRLIFIWLFWVVIPEHVKLMYLQSFRVEFPRFSECFECVFFRVCSDLDPSVLGMNNEIVSCEPSARMDDLAIFAKSFHGGVELDYFWRILSIMFLTTASDASFPLRCLYIRLSVKSSRR